MNEAIKLAMGEWFGATMLQEKLAGVWLYDETGKRLACLTYSEIVINPEFWRALGKALGWDYWMCIDCNKPIENCVNPDVHRSQHGDWSARAHDYFDLLLTGGDTEKFWKDLLK